MQVKAWVTTFYTPADLSDALIETGLTHSLQLGTRSKRRVIHAGKDQVAAHIAGNFSSMREGVCNFIVCCYAEAARAKCQRLPSTGDLASIVRYAVNCEIEQDFELSPALSPMDYVNEVTEPSLLSDIQTLLLRINPYDLRKQAEKLVVQALAGRVPIKDTMVRLESNLKTAPLAPCLAAAARLRRAVKASHKLGSVGAAEKYGVAEFEINYIRMKCDSKTNEKTTT